MTLGQQTMLACSLILLRYRHNSNYCANYISFRFLIAKKVHCRLIVSSMVRKAKQDYHCCALLP
uniref:Uncharacterized protein n=1 Tax=Arundo donax TaxID=35708 RepID=A0A0A9BSA8_ARUDO